jgi:hypothetical protein
MAPRMERGQTVGVGERRCEEGGRKSTWMKKEREREGNALL